MTIRELNIQKFETWATLEIAQHRYVGEIVLEPEELCDLSKILGIKLGRIRSHGFAYPSSLTIAAVNCAYYHLDTEGFWPHFLKLLHLGDVPTDPIGDIIESCLFKARKLAETRTGGWRYVGPIIEQCGVTTNYLESYGSFLKSLHQRFGWEKTLGLDFCRYNAMVPSFSTRYLTMFLKEKAGWEFTYNVVRALHHYFKGYVSLDELKHQKGFHKSFWDGILPFLAISRSKHEIQIPTAHDLPHPTFVFLPEQKSLAIKLDANLVDRGYYRFGEITCSSQFILVGRGKVPFQSGYQIDVQGKACYIKGWIPGTPRYAFFHCVNGLVGNLHQLRPGTYYLIATYDLDLPVRIILSEIGSTQLAGNRYQCLLVRIQSPEDLAFTGIARTLPKSFLSWEYDTNSLDCAVDSFRVFTEKLPRIIVQAPERFVSGEFGLYVDLDGLPPKKIEVSGIGTCIVDISSLLAKGADRSWKGSVRVVPLGRTNFIGNQEYADTMDFAVVPRSCITLSQPFFGVDEEVLISVDCESGTFIRFNNSSRIGEHFWRVDKPATTVIEGTLDASPLSVHLALVIPRGAITRADMKCSIEREELFGNVQLLAHGLPLTPVKLYLEVDGRRHFLGESGQFGSSGRAVVAAGAFAASLSLSGEKAGHFCLEGAGRIVRTGLSYWNAAALWQEIIENNVSGAWKDFVPEETLAVFLELSALTSCHCTQFDTARLEQIPKHIVTKVNLTECLVCAEYLDNAKINWRDAHRDIDEAALVVLRWYSDAKGFLENTNQWPGNRPKAWNPILPRWILELDRVERLVLSVNALAGENRHLVMLLEDWSRDVTSPEIQPQYSSALANLAYGKALVDAWKLYRKGAYRVSYQKAATVEKNAVDVLVQQLASIVLVLCLTNTDRAHLVQEGNDGEKGEIGIILRNLRSRALHGSANHSVNTLIAALLPFNDSDAFDRK